MVVYQVNVKTFDSISFTLKYRMENHSLCKAQNDVKINLQGNSV